jgi:small-conductance mechanosensitive channel
MFANYISIVHFILVTGKKKTAKPPVEPDTLKAVASDSSRSVVEFLSQQSATDYLIFLVIILVITAAVILPRFIDHRKVNHLFKIGLSAAGTAMIAIFLWLIPKSMLLIICSAVVLTLVIALYDLIRNVIARILIAYRAPFKKDDIISIDGRTGKVSVINLCVTHLQTVNNSMITIPNNRFLKTILENHSNGKKHVQVPVHLYLPLEIDLEKVREIAQAAVKVSRYVNLDHALDVTISNVLQSGRSVISLTLYAAINDLAYEDLFRSEVTESIIFELKKHHLITAIQPS